MSARTLQVLPLPLAVALVCPAIVAQLAGFDLSAVVAVLLYAAAFVGAALLLVWGTELAQLELSAGIAITVLALVAILPEYAIDLLFAYQAGSDPSKAPLALANMTGANRLLIGVGWSLAVLMGALGARHARAKAGSSNVAEARAETHYALALSRRSAIDVFLLACVSLYTLTFLFRASLTLLDAGLLFAAFGFYVYRLWTATREEPHFIGPPALIAKLPKRARRAATLALLGAAATVIFLSAKPFSTALVAAGRALGIDEFLMVQWVAPFATEIAELVPACIFAYRQSADKGLGTLLSSKINQWTLLVGGVPIAYAIASSTGAGLPIDRIQARELFLTAAQSVFAVTLLMDDLRLGTREALVILVLFVADLVASMVLAPQLRSLARLGCGGLYLLLSIGTLLRARHHVRELSHNAIFVPLRELSPEPHEAQRVR